VETDTSRAFFSNRDVVEFVTEELGFYSDYGPSTATNTWGCALLSAYPILRSSRIILPSPEGELACLIDADLEVNGTAVNVIVTHFGNTEGRENLM
jgi:endonuclease/exonuclease/phosphatase family metal-dependent hydrolase